MPTGTLERNKEIVRSLYEDGVSEGNLELLGELVAPDYVGGNGERGPAGFRAMIEGLRSAFPDIRFTVEDLVAEGDRVTIRWTWHATHLGAFRGLPPSNKALSNEGIAILQVRNEKIVRAWLQTDRLGLLEQIGALPAGQAAGGRPTR